MGLGLRASNAGWGNGGGKNFLPPRRYGVRCIHDGVHQPAPNGASERPTGEIPAWRSHQGGLEIVPADARRTIRGPHDTLDAGRVDWNLPRRGPLSVDLAKGRATPGPAGVPDSPRSHAEVRGAEPPSAPSPAEAHVRGPLLAADLRHREASANPRPLEHRDDDHLPAVCVRRFEGGVGPRRRHLPRVASDLPTFSMDPRPFLGGSSIYRRIFIELC